MRDKLSAVQLLELISVHIEDWFKNEESSYEESSNINNLDVSDNEKEHF